jgi:hypothetical protein
VHPVAPAPPAPTGVTAKPRVLRRLPTHRAMRTVNFGSISFDFHTSTLKVDILGIDGDVRGPLLSANWTFDELNGSPSSRLPSAWEGAATPPPLERSWTCKLGRGGPNSFQIIAGYAVSTTVIYSLAMRGVRACEADRCPAQGLHRKVNRRAISKVGREGGALLL